MWTQAHRALGRVSHLCIDLELRSFFTASLVSGVTSEHSASMGVDPGLLSQRLKDLKIKEYRQTHTPGNSTQINTLEKLVCSHGTNSPSRIYLQPKKKSSFIPETASFKSGSIEDKAIFMRALEQNGRQVHITSDIFPGDACFECISILMSFSRSLSKLGAHTLFLNTCALF